MRLCTPSFVPSELPFEFVDLSFGIALLSCIVELHCIALLRDMLRHHVFFWFGI